MLQNIKREVIFDANQVQLISMIKFKAISFFLMLLSIKLVACSDGNNVQSISQLALIIESGKGKVGIENVLFGKIFEESLSYVPRESDVVESVAIINGDLFSRQTKMNIIYMMHTSDLRGDFSGEYLKMLPDEVVFEMLKNFNEKDFSVMMGDKSYRVFTNATNPKEKIKILRKVKVELSLSALKFLFDKRLMTLDVKTKD